MLCTKLVPVNLVGLHGSPLQGVQGIAGNVALLRHQRVHVSAQPDDVATFVSDNVAMSVAAHLARVHIRHFC